jgi:hypothetical protein
VLHGAFSDVDGGGEQIDAPKGPGKKKKSSSETNSGKNKKLRRELEKENTHETNERTKT